MFSEHFVLQGKPGVKRLNQAGPYAVIVNKRLFENGTAGKYTLVNSREHWVDSVHDSRAEAVNEARQRYAG